MPLSFFTRFFSAFFAFCHALGPTTSLPVESNGAILLPTARAYSCCCVSLLPAGSGEVTAATPGHSLASPGNFVVVVSLQSGRTPPSSSTQGLPFSSRRTRYSCFDECPRRIFLWCSSHQAIPLRKKRGVPSGRSLPGVSWSFHWRHCASRACAQVVPASVFPLFFVLLLAISMTGVVVA